MKKALVRNQHTFGTCRSPCLCPHDPLSLHYAPHNLQRFWKSPKFFNDRTSADMHIVTSTCCVQCSKLTFNLLAAVVSPGTTSTCLSSRVAVSAFDFLISLSLTLLSLQPKVHICLRSK